MSATIAALVGVLLGVHFAKSSSDGVVELSKPPPAKRLSGQSLGNGGREKLNDTMPAQKTLQREREFAAIDPAMFPDMLETALRSAKSGEELYGLASAWIERDPDGFVAWLQRRPGRWEAGHGLSLTYVLLERLSGSDPEKAWEVASVLPGDTSSMQMSVVSNALEKNPDEALSLVRDHRDTISLARVGSWPRIDPLTALPLVNELLPGRKRRSLIRAAVSHYRSYPDKLAESKAWFGQLTPELQTQARESVEKAAQRDPRMKKLLEAWEEGG